MDEPLTTGSALAAGGVLLLAAVVVVLVVHAAADGRLGPNAWAGIRLLSLFRSREAWQRGHQAARRPADIGAGGMGLAGLVLIPLRDQDAFLVVALGGAIWAVGWLLVGAVRASAAASAVPREGAVT